jgi:RNA polymerase sigma-70 factor (ECF subfamily)
MVQDRQRFERIYADCYEPVLRYCLRRSNREDALDAAAETFTIAWRRYQAMPGGRELPWLYGIARNVLRHQWRSAGRESGALTRLRSDVDAAVACVEDVAIEHAQIDDALAALGRLDEGDREIIQLAAWEDLDRGAIATALGCSPNAASKRLRRALDHLAHQMEVPVAPRGRLFARRRVSS